MSLILSVFLICFDIEQITAILFPEFSVLQITSALSIPIEIPNRKIYFDYGFQMNYMLPYNVTDSLNNSLWSQVNKRSIDKDFYKKYGGLSNRAAVDLSAGELYNSIEDILHNFGFHKTCLLKSVCEISRHPFHIEKPDLVSELITLILRPSVHKAFNIDESTQKTKFESAEIIGAMGLDCDKVYSNCPKSLLNLASYVKFQDEI